MDLREHLRVFSFYMFRRKAMMRGIPRMRERGFPKLWFDG